MTEAKEHDAVHSPKHYQIPGTGIEVIDVIEGILTPEQFEGYCYGNIIKYILRAPNKNGAEDLKKAAELFTVCVRLVSATKLLETAED